MPTTLDKILVTFVHIPGLGTSAQTSTPFNQRKTIKLFVGFSAEDAEFTTAAHRSRRDVEPLSTQAIETIVGQQFRIEPAIISQLTEMPK